MPLINRLREISYLYPLNYLKESRTYNNEYLLYILESIDNQLLDINELDDISKQIKFLTSNKYEKLMLVLKNILFLKPNNLPLILQIIDLNLYVSFNKTNKNKESLVKLDKLFTAMRMVYDYGRHHNPSFKYVLFY